MNNLRQVRTPEQAFIQRLESNGFTNSESRMIVDYLERMRGGHNVTIPFNSRIDPSLLESMSDAWREVAPNVSRISDLSRGEFNRIFRNLFREGIAVAPRSLPETMEDIVPRVVERGRRERIEVPGPTVERPRFERREAPNYEGLSQAERVELARRDAWSRGGARDERISMETPTETREQRVARLTRERRLDRTVDRLARARRERREAGEAAVAEVAPSETIETTRSSTEAQSYRYGVVIDGHRYIVGTSQPLVGGTTTQEQALAALRRLANGLNSENSISYVIDIDHVNAAGERTPIDVNFRDFGSIYRAGFRSGGDMTIRRLARR